MDQEHSIASRRPLPGDCPFSQESFALLCLLHDDPTPDCYDRHKDALLEHVKEPFEQFFRAVGQQLPLSIATEMETERGLFGRLRKNDWRGNAPYDYYWGAFYPKGGKRTGSAQLLILLSHEDLMFGFSIGRKGAATRERLVTNARRHKKVLLPLLNGLLGIGDLPFGAPESSWATWLESPDESDPRPTLLLSKAVVPQQTTEQLIGQVVHTFMRVFPLVLLATRESPLPSIRRYLSSTPVSAPDPNVQEAEDVVEDLAGRRSSRQGPRLDPVLRRAIEDYAMDKAKAHYGEGWNVEDVSKKESCDLHCTRAGQNALRVEVKGTTSEGSSILLTANEVEHARRHYPDVALFIVANIQVNDSPATGPLLSGGDTSILEPWDIDAGVLKPVGYEYIPPSHT